MFECRTCLLRALRTIASDGCQPQRTIRPRSFLKPSSLRQQRTFSQTIARFSTPQDVDSGELDDFSALLPEQSSLTANGDVKRQAKGDLASAADQRAAKIEIQYLHDPLKVAEHVLHTVSRSPGKALEICRLASKSMNCVVSWNHCVDYHMSQGSVDDAIKIYNEMKKRAQFPDSYTYSLLLRGFVDRPKMLQKALTIYNSMFSINSRVKPLILHTNIILDICRAAGDMDALWGVVSKLSASGGQKPNHITYSIILKAIHGSMAEPAGHRQDQAPTAEAVQKAVDEGRRIWQDIVANWRRGEILIDEMLILDMAQVLLSSHRIEDWDDVLSLVEQTTNLERLIPPLNSPERHSEHVPRPQSEEVHPTTISVEDGWEDTPASDAFKPVKAAAVERTSSGRPASIVWAEPGPLVLSAVIGACTQMREPRAADSYWEKLVREKGVRPNKQNVMRMLTLYRHNRSSKKTAQLMEEIQTIPKFDATNMVFRMALGVCARDWKNPQVVEHANTIVDTLAAMQPYPDAHSLAAYLSLVLKAQNGEHLIASLERLGPMIHTLRSRVTFGADGVHLEPASHREDKAETVILFRAVIGAIDMLLQRELITPEETREWQSRKARLRSFVARASYLADTERQEDVDFKQRIRAYRAAKALVNYRKTNMKANNWGQLAMSKEQWAERLKRFKRADERKKIELEKSARFLKYNSSEGKKGMSASRFPPSSRRAPASATYSDPDQSPSTAR